MSKPSTSRPSPKRPKTDPKSQKFLSPVKSSPGKSSPQKPSPIAKKFSPKKYYKPKRFSPRKDSPRKISFTSESQGTNTDDNVVLQSKEDVTGRSTSTSTEAYYSANFKEVLCKCLLASNPERHVISEQEVSLVDEFMRLEGMCMLFCIKYVSCARNKDWVIFTCARWTELQLPCFTDLASIYKSHTYLTNVTTYV